MSSISKSVSKQVIGQLGDDGSLFYNAGDYQVTTESVKNIIVLNCKLLR